MAASTHVATLRIEGMTCSACSMTVERALAAVKGVREAGVSCVTGLARVEFDPAAASTSELTEAVEDVGFGAEVEQEVQARPARQSGNDAAGMAPVSVELKIGGMTCSACSGTVERLLLGLPGVTRASVSLILGRAFVTYDASSPLAPEKLKEEIEDVGFDAEVVSVGAADEAQSGRAVLHLNVIVAPAAAVAGVGTEQFEVIARSLPGVHGCQLTSTGPRRLVYDPAVVGARSLLESLRQQLGSDYEVEWVNVSAENEQLQNQERHICGLHRDMRRAAPPAVLIFLFVILLPSLGMHQLGLLTCGIHHGIDTLTLAILLLATPVHFLVGRRFHKAAYGALKRRAPNMDVLVSVASNTSYFYSTGLLFFCLIMPETSTTHELVKATRHFFAMGPVLIAVVLLGKNMEARAKLKAMRALIDLPSNMPEVATVCREKGAAGNADLQVPVQLVELGDILRIYPGARVPVDGIMYSESSVHMDESLLTGESAPVAKRQGDLLLGGTLCVSGGCLMRVSRVGSETTLGQMQQLVQDAQAGKADVQRAADAVARVFVPFVVGLSGVTFLIWTILVFSERVYLPPIVAHGKDHGMMMEDQVTEWHTSLKLMFAMKFGIAVLMIACPCAMGLATPMAVMVATGVAAKKGCLIKHAPALESAARVNAILLDKTGTITQGAPAVRFAACLVDTFEPLANAWAAYCRGAGISQQGSAQPGGKEPHQATTSNGAPEMHVLDSEGAGDSQMASEAQNCFWWLLGALETTSDHPIATSIVAKVQRLQGLPPIVPPSDFECISGRGVRGCVEQLGAVTVRAGNLRFFEETLQALQLPPPKADDPKSSVRARRLQQLLGWATSMQEQGHTLVLIHVDGVPFGAVALQDPIREDAAWVVDHLKTKLKLDVWMCTGDNTATAQSIAQQVGISNVVAEALPATKSDCVRQLQDRGCRVCFVGDGMNDSPALAQADVGLAIGVGAHVAVQAADVALMRSELSDVVAFLALSRATFRTIILNFFWAFCFNAVCLPMAAGLFYPAVYVPPLMAGVGMAASSLLVVGSSLLLRNFQAPKADLDPEAVPLYRSVEEKKKKLPALPAVRPAIRQTLRPKSYGRQWITLKEEPGDGLGDAA